MSENEFQFLIGRLETIYSIALFTKSPSRFNSS